MGIFILTPLFLFFIGIAIFVYAGLPQKNPPEGRTFSELMLLVLYLAGSLFILSAIGLSIFVLRQLAQATS